MPLTQEQYWSWELMTKTRRYLEIMMGVVYISSILNRGLEARGREKHTELPHGQ